MAIITVLNGPNLNLLAVREPAHYGNKTLEEIENTIKSKANSLGHQLDFHQSNAEHDIVNLIHSAFKNHVDFILINPAALTHTSIAIRDAFLATKIPFIEVHLSNIHAREAFRAHSYFSDIAVGVISGLGVTGYELALQAAHRILREKLNDGY